MGPGGSGVRRLLLTKHQGKVNKTGKVKPFKMPSPKALGKMFRKKKKRQ